jgi:hypothetical protein
MSAAAFINAPFLGEPKLHFVTSAGVAKRYLAGQPILGIGRVHTNVDLCPKLRTLDILAVTEVILVLEIHLAS